MGRKIMSPKLPNPRHIGKTTIWEQESVFQVSRSGLRLAFKVQGLTSAGATGALQFVVEDLGVEVEGALKS